jgi:hypothetical protein
MRKPELGLLRGFGGVLLLEALDASGGVEEFLLAREERVAARADFHSNQVSLDCRASLKRAPTGAVNRHRMVIGMNSFFHGSSSPPTGLRGEGGPRSHSRVARPASKLLV